MMLLRRQPLVPFFVYFSILQVITTVSALSSATYELSTTSHDYNITNSLNNNADDRGDGNQLVQVPMRCSEFYTNKAAVRCTCTLYPDSNEVAYIPLLPKLITTLSLDLQQTNLRSSIEDRNFFANVTQLEALDLSTNFLEWVAAGVFDLMPNLTWLDISTNPMSNSTALRNILSTPSLVEVRAYDCKFSLEETFLDDIDMSNVQVLVLHRNPMTVVNLTPMCRLKRLKILNLRYCQIKSVLINCVLSSLERLDLHGNFVYDLLTCDPNGRSYFPELKVLLYGRNLDHRISSLVYYPVCLLKLKELNLDGSSTKMAFDYFNAGRYPSLQELHVARLGCTFIGLVESMFNNSAIELLDFSENFLDFSSETVTREAFSACRNLTTLNLSQNIFSGTSDEKFQALFGHLPLQKLYLKRTELCSVSQMMFSTLTLLQSLDLSYNKIVYIPDGTFDRLVSLRVLYLTQNQIQTVSLHTFGDQMRSNLYELSLSQNPFVCSCDLLWFRSMLRTHPMFNNSNIYICSNRPDNVTDFFLPDQVCLMSHEVSGYIITFCAIFITTLTTFLLLFSYRWHFRLLLYEAFRGRDDGVRQRRLLQNNFDFDVFVSYAHQDLPWVRQHLMPNLEDRLGLRLCIHERDFIAGNNIVDNIAENVERSKKVLMVFSNHFVLSQWCQFELMYCLRHVMEYDDALIILCVDDVTSREMTTAMMAVLKMTTYIQWAGYDDAIRAFWGRVQIALHEILDREHRV